MSSPQDTSIEIKRIFEDNQINDLKRFMKKRECLNKTNNIFIYLFHFVQSLGIFVTMVAAGYNLQHLVWFGVALNSLATLIHVYEKTNDATLKRLLNQIKNIKEGTYVDEDALIEVEKEENVVKNGEHNNNTNNSTKTNSTVNESNATNANATNATNTISTMVFQNPMNEHKNP